MSPGQLLAAAEQAPSQAGSMGPGEQLVLAVVLMGVALLLLVIELFLVSFGLIGVAAAGVAIYAIVLAFGVSQTAGWIFLVAGPVLALAILRWGLKRLQSSSFVPQLEITDDAGVHHLAERVGAAIGAPGELVTHARPGGRARFAEGECDVQVRGGALDKGTTVVVKSIDGPMVFVVAAEDGDDPTATPPNKD